MFMKISMLHILCATCGIWILNQKKLSKEIFCMSTSFVDYKLTKGWMFLPSPGIWIGRESNQLTDACTYGGVHMHGDELYKHVWYWRKFFFFSKDFTYWIRENLEWAIKFFYLSCTSNFIYIEKYWEILYSTSFSFEIIFLS